VECFGGCWGCGVWGIGCLRGCGSGVCSSGIMMTMTAMMRTAVMYGLRHEAGAIEQRKVVGRSSIRKSIMKHSMG
jgi:hypothetical protein